MCIIDPYYAHNFLTNCGDNWIQLLTVASYTSKTTELGFCTANFVFVTLKMCGNGRFKSTFFFLFLCCR